MSSDTGIMGDTMSELLGAHFRFIRESKTDYSQTEVARLLFMDRSTYSNYELGKTEPSIDPIKRMCKVFEVDATTLLCYEDNEYLQTSNKHQINSKHTKLHAITNNRQQ